MTWWGKLIGAICGYLFAGPLGAVIGLIIGHNFDYGFKSYLAKTYVTYTPSELAKIQYTFFRATFSVMGQIAKADGHISVNEIQLARSIMRQMRLNAELQQEAINLFQKGKQPQFNLSDVLIELRQACREQRPLLRIFIEVQISAAMADGLLSDQARYLLHTICHALGFSLTDFDDFMGVNPNSQNQQQQQGQQQQSTANKVTALKKAYVLLEIAETASDAEVKTAYRKLMSQNHPDKLISKGLPEEMMRLATTKTQQIRSAYDLIRKTRAG